MKAQRCIILSILLCCSFLSHATDNARTQYQSMTTLQGEWVLSPAGQQEGKQHRTNLLHRRQEQTQPQSVSTDW